MILLLALPVSAQDPSLADEQKNITADLVRLREAQTDVRARIDQANEMRKRVETWYSPQTPDYDRPSKDEVILTLGRLEEQASPAALESVVGLLADERTRYDERRSAIDAEIAGPASDRTPALRRLRLDYTAALKELALLLELNTTEHRTLRAAFLQLRQENLFLRGRSDLTWSSIKQAGSDLKALPAWLGTAGRAVLAYVTDMSHLAALLQLLGLVVAAFLVFFLCARSLRKRQARTPPEKKFLRRLLGLLENIVHPIGVALAAWLVPYGAALLLPELPDNVRAYLRMLGWVLGGFWLLRTIATRLCRPRTGGDGETLVPPAAARRLAFGIRLVMWLSLAMLPILFALEHLGYENEGAREGLWLLYKVLLGLVLIFVLLKRRFLESLVPPDAGRSSKLASSAIRYFQPVAVLLVPALLLLDALRYDIIARLITRFSVAAVIAAIAGALLYRVFRSLLDAWLTRAYADEPSVKREAATGALHFGLRVVMVVLVLGGFLRLAGSDLAEMRSFLDIPLPLQEGKDAPKTWWNVLVAFIMFYVFLKATTPARRALRELILRKTSMDEGLRYTISTLAGYFLLGTGAYLALQQLVDLSNFGYLVAALSVGLGFGLQEIVSNFVSGLILLFERPLKVGDLIQVGDKLGIVRRINIRATTVQTQDNVYLLVPNREFITQTVINYAHDDPKLRIHVGVGVSYDSDTALVRETLEKVAVANKRVLAQPEPIVRFLSFGDSSLDFEVLAWIERPPQQFDIGSDLCFDIFEAFNAAGIDIPFPQRDLHVKSIVPASLTSGAAGPAASEAEPS